jgi:hypothetical protein
MEKRKGKSTLLSSGSFSFIAPMSPEECAERLRTVEQPWEWFSREYVHVNINYTSKQRITFAVEKRVGKNMSVIAEGTLRERGNHVTFVKGSIRMNTFYRIFAPIFFPIYIGFGIIMFITGEEMGIFFLAMGSIICIGHLSIMFSAKQSLAQLIHDTLRNSYTHEPEYFEDKSSG